MYKKNELKKVILRIDFKTLHGFVDSFNNQLSAVDHEFKVDLLDTINVMDEIGPIKKGDSVVTRKQVLIKTKQKQDVNGFAKLTFNDSCIVFEFLSYTCFSDFINFTKEILKELFKNDLDITRTGIRFVNIFEPQYSFDCFSDRGKYFLQNQPLESDNLSLSRSIIQEEYINDPIRIKTIFGYYNPTFPSALFNRNVLLDIDASLFVRINESNGMLNYIEKAIHSIESIFESYITDSMRKKLNG